VDLPPSPPNEPYRQPQATQDTVSRLGAAICDPNPVGSRGGLPPKVPEGQIGPDTSQGFNFQSPSPDDVARKAQGLPGSLEIDEVGGQLGQLNLGPVSPPVLPKEEKEEEPPIFSSTTGFKAGDKESDDEEEADGDGKDKLSMVVLGHVDAGKSTLMGQVLLQLGKVNQRQINKYQQEAKDIGKASFFLAWVMDEGSEERNHGVTMDIGQKHIQTPTKDVTLLDAPGHQDFIPKMISGASQADVAILVVPATTGEFEAGFDLNGQTKEHALLARGLGVKQVLVAVNKMDAADPPWHQPRYQQIQDELDPFLKKVGFKPKQVRYVPVSGMTGENVLEVSEDCTLKEWYDGLSLLEAVDKFNPAARVTNQPLRAFITDIIPGGGKAGVVVAVRAVQGKVKAGQRVQIFPSGDVGTVKSIVCNAGATNKLSAGDNAEVTIGDIDSQRVSVGHVLCKPNRPIFVGSTFSAQIFTLETLKVPLIKGTQCSIHTQSVDAPCNLKRLLSILNKSGEVKHEKPRAIPANSTAVVKIKCEKALCLEKYSDCRPLGRFVLRQRGVTIAAGIITELHPV